MMRFFLLASSIIFFSCNTGADSEKVQGVDAALCAKFSWENQIHDFGTISQKQEVSHTFVFTNKGPANLVIADAKGSCGCTVADFPKLPIAPGQKGKIAVSFNPKGKQGMQTKVVTLKANTKSGSERIVIKANIKP